MPVRLNPSFAHEKIGPIYIHPDKPSIMLHKLRNQSAPRTLKLCGILPLLLLASCKESETSDRASGSRSYYEGTWEAEGPLPVGYNHGNYRIRIEADESGDCRATVVHQTNKTAISEDLTDTIDLAGKWELSEEGMTADLKVRSWVTTGPGGYRREREFDDFTTAYGFRRSGDLLVMANGIGHHGTFKVGTTEDARDGMKMIVEGRGHQLHGPRFSKVEDPAPMPAGSLRREAGEAPPEPPGPATAEATDGIPPGAAPVGEWSTKERTPVVLLSFRESGEATGSFLGPWTTIHLEGTWQTLTEGRWIGHVVFSGKVTHWVKDQVTDVTPADQTFEFMFAPGESKLTYVRGGSLKDRNGESFHPAGIHGNEDPVLYREDK